MKQIIIRVLVAIAMSALTSVIGFTSFSVISNPIQIHTELFWILKLILASFLSPLLYRFLDRQTARWAIRAGHKSYRSSNRLIL